MRTHPVDLTSLVWGIILATITGLLAVLVFTDTTPDLGILVPAALICAGLLVLITALLRRGPHPGTLSWIAERGSGARTRLTDLAPADSHVEVGSGGRRAPGPTLSQIGGRPGAAFGVLGPLLGR